MGIRRGERIIRISLIATFLLIAHTELPVAAAFASSLRMSASASASPSSTNRPKVIDSHLHIWASSPQAASGYPYADGQEPPSNLAERASSAVLIRNMQESRVDGALIVQPINHKFDHSYVASAIKENPGKFKGMLLHDPSLGPKEAVSRLEDLSLQGFVGVRFNPYLWPEGTAMSEPDGCGVAVYKRCAELNMPVGVMCFKGLELHYDDIIKLIESSPETVLVLDHFGFTRLDETGDKAFQQLLSLSKYAHTVVKISGIFRVAEPGADSFPYEGVRRKRFDPLLESFGAERLMFGTDFPFVLEEDGAYKGTVDVVGSWADGSGSAVMGGTAERIFGPWGVV